MSNVPVAVQVDPTLVITHNRQDIKKEKAGSHQKTNSYGKIETFRNSLSKKSA